MVRCGHKKFSSLCCQLDERQQQTIAFDQRIMQTFKEEYNQSRGKGTEKALNEQTSVIPDTDY